MSIGIALSPLTLDTTDNAVDAAVVLGHEAADAGLSSVWLGQRFTHDTISLAGILGREVSGIEVGTSVVPIMGRHPLLTASQAQTAQAATGGGFTLGLGLGSAHFAAALGVPHDRPITRLREFLTVLTATLTTGAADFEGDTVSARTSGGAMPLATTVAGARPPVPVLVAAMGPQALRVTGELADGTLPYLVGPQALERHIVAPLTAAAERAGRARPRVGVLVPGVVTADVAGAQEAAAQQTALYDSIPSYQRIIELSGATKAAELVVIGDEQAMATRVTEYFEAGATDVILTQTDLTTPADRQRTWQLLGGLNLARNA